MEFYRYKNINKTRKYHRCHLCELDIPKGSKCLYEAGKYDGEFFNRYSHNECAKLWSDMNSSAHYWDDNEWIPFRDMAEIYPYNKFHDWQREIGKTYNVLDGDGL